MLSNLADKIKGKQQLLIDRIRKGENLLHVTHAKIDDMTTDELKGYLAKLRKKWTGTGETGTSESGACVAGKIPEATPEVTFDQLPQDIKQLLGNVAGKYEVEPKQIYDEYIDLKGKLDNPYPLDDFKIVLTNAGVAFERGFIRPLKMDYTDKLFYEKMTIFSLTALNSKDDIIDETYKIEGILYDLGEKHILSKRAKSLGETQLEKADKQALVAYHEKMFDLLKRIKGGKRYGSDSRNRI